MSRSAPIPMLPDMRKVMTVLVLSVMVAPGACGEADQAVDSESRRAPSTSTGSKANPPVVDITATEYAFKAPATVQGGLVEVNFSNVGKEPHFAGLARVAPGKTFADVRAALTAPPSAPRPPGPPPFQQFAGAPTADPGSAGRMTFELSAGSYALFCTLPSPDGAPHVVKGMISELTVTEPTRAPATLPEAVGTVTATDFTLTGTPELAPGRNVVKLRNDGRQLHEITLVELAAGSTTDAVVAWFKKPTGPPPHKSLSGVAVRPGAEGTAALDLKPGKTYAFVCVIPDSLGDFAPHIAKGMFTPTFTV